MSAGLAFGELFGRGFLGRCFFRRGLLLFRRRLFLGPFGGWFLVRSFLGSRLLDVGALGAGRRLLHVRALRRARLLQVGALVTSTRTLVARARAFVAGTRLLVRKSAARAFVARTGLLLVLNSSAK